MPDCSRVHSDPMTGMPLRTGCSPPPSTGWAGGRSSTWTSTDIQRARARSPRPCRRSAGSPAGSPARHHLSAPRLAARDGHEPAAADLPPVGTATRRRAGGRLLPRRRLGAGQHPDVRPALLLPRRRGRARWCSASTTGWRPSTGRRRRPWTASTPSAGGGPRRALGADTSRLAVAATAPAATSPPWSPGRCATTVDRSSPPGADLPRHRRDDEPAVDRRARRRAGAHAGPRSRPSWRTTAARTASPRTTRCSRRCGPPTTPGCRRPWCRPPTSTRCATRAPSTPTRLSRRGGPGAAHQLPRRAARVRQLPRGHPHRRAGPGRAGRRAALAPGLRPHRPVGGRVVTVQTWLLTSSWRSTTPTTTPAW